MTITATSIGLSWSAPNSGGAVGAYMVLSRITGGGAFAILADPVVGTSYTATGLLPSISYDFAVAARNSAGPGALSGVVTAQTTGLVPQAATAITAVAGTPAYGAALVSWTAPAATGLYGAATGYHVYQSLHPVSGWTYVADTSGTSYTFTGLAHSTGYDFLIVPFNAAGGSVANNSYSNWLTDRAPPNTPAIGSVAPIPDGTVTKLAVTWAVSTVDGTHDAATGYNLRYSVHAANTWTVVAGVSSGAVITGLLSGTSYDVQVQATNSSAASPSAWSGSTTASTYATVMSWNAAGPNPWVHTLGGQAVNVNCTPNPGSGSTGGVNFTWSTSATINNDCSAANDRFSRGTGSTTGDNSYPFAGNKWGVYLTPPTAPGTYYIWALTTVGDGGIVSPAVTVT
jgi:hypothetical protein